MLLQVTEILEKIWLDHNASEHKAEGFKKLCLSSAVYDEHRYLNTVFFSLTDSLRAIDKKLKEKIIRLKNFVDEWEACEAFRETLNKCFEEMTRTKTRRNIYSILLMHNCTPEKPEYMGRVKNLLESVLPQELVITCDMLEQIVLNYIDCLDVFLRTVHEWRTDDSNTDSPENYVRYAMLFAFNANTAQQPSQNEFGYRVLEKITAPGSLLKLSDLMIFLFSDKGKADFINTLKKSKKTVTDDEIIEDIDRVFALVFVKWLEILVLIRKNTPEADWNAHELIAGAIKTAQDQIPVKPVRKAVTNLRTFYNALIMGQPITTPEEKFYKEVLIAKRNYANDILEIINQNN
jgi:hypothetical protein